MNNIDKHNKLKAEVFSYKVSKDNKVFIYWKHKQIMTLKGRKAEAFLNKVEDADAFAKQLIIARMTGNFKHGNER